MGFENLKEIIDFAIEKEQEAADFYDAASRMETMSGIREMLQEFAVQERRHRQLLERIEDEGIIEGLAEYKFKWITDIKRSNYVVEMDYRSGMPYNEVLMLAAKREERALALYNELLANAETDGARTLFKMLCQEEARHKLFLETQYDDYMAKMGD